MRSFSKDLLKSPIVHGAMVRGYNINYSSALPNIYLTTLLTSPIKVSLYFQKNVRHLNEYFREVRKIYGKGLRSKFMRVNLFL